MFRQVIDQNHANSWFHYSSEVLAIRSVKFISFLSRINKSEIDNLAPIDRDKLRGLMNTNKKIKSS